MRAVKVINQTRPLPSPLVADYCDSFWCKLRGLSFRSSLPLGSALILVDGSESRVNSAIHMLGMKFDLGIIWLSKSLKVVDLRLAKRWRSFVAPREPAQYVIECGALRLEEFSLGDQLVFEEIT
jgi:uncharacterized membrane protein (UPF0127 family)